MDPQMEIPYNMPTVSLGVMEKKHMPLFSTHNSFFLSLPWREITYVCVRISINLAFIKVFFPFKKILTFPSWSLLFVKAVVQTVFSCLSASFVIFVESQEACCIGE